MQLFVSAQHGRSIDFKMSMIIMNMNRRVTHCSLYWDVNEHCSCSCNADISSLSGREAGTKTLEDLATRSSPALATEMGCLDSFGFFIGCGDSNAPPSCTFGLVRSCWNSVTDFIHNPFLLVEHSLSCWSNRLWLHAKLYETQYSYTAAKDTHRHKLWHIKFTSNQICQIF